MTGKLTLNWQCDFCKHGYVTISPAGVLYCEECRMSYGKTIWEANSE